MTQYAYDIALLLSVAIVAATGGAWWSDRGWRRKYLSLRRLHGLTIGKPLDFYDTRNPVNRRNDRAKLAVIWRREG